MSQVYLIGVDLGTSVVKATLLDASGVTRADTTRRAWSTELVEMFELSLDKLPRIVPATTVIGSLTAEAVRACGLMTGIPLVAGAGDQVARCLGAGLVRPGQLS